LGEGGSSNEEERNEDEASQHKLGAESGEQKAHAETKASFVRLNFEAAPQ
jgi:hypothetical protein